MFKQSGADIYILFVLWPWITSGEVSDYIRFKYYSLELAIQLMLYDLKYYKC